jgi:Tfp pilus assembly protein PilO
MKIEKKQIIIIAIMLVMALGFIFFQYLPMSRAIAESRQQQKIAQQQAENDQAKNIKLPSMQEQVENLRQKVGDYDAKIPQDRDFGNFMQNITAFMSKNNLKEQLVKPAGEMNFEQVSIIPVSIECSGTFSEIFNFLKDFENSQRLFSLEHIRLENNTYSGNLKLYAKCNIFYRQ